MRVLVTGASGFIGSYVVDRLREEGHEPVAFDRRQPVLDAGEIEHQLGDVRDFTSIVESMATVERFVHLAGVLGTQETVWDPQPAVETNIRGSLNVFKAARRYEVPGVYIAVGNHWMNNSYSISKTTAERFAFMFNAEHGTRVAVVRALNAYGPRQKAKPVRKIMPNLVLPALARSDIQIYGDGNQVMDMIYVEDVADVLVRAATVGNVEHGNYATPFEAGTGRKTTVNDVLSEVLSAVARHDGTSRDDLDALVHHVPMRPGEVPDSVVLGDPSTLAPLGIQPGDLVDLEEGVERTVAWYAKAKVGA